jgi:hypothetical protein
MIGTGHAADPWSPGTRPPRPGTSPPHGQQPMKEVDVTHLQSGHLTDPQRRRRQDHHAVTPGLMTTPLDGFLDQPAQRADVRQGEVAGTLLSLYRRSRPTDDAPPSPILRAGCAPAAPSHRLVHKAPRPRRSDRLTDRGFFLPLDRSPSISPAVIIDTGRCPSAGEHAFAQPAEYGSRSTWDRSREPTDLPIGHIVWRAADSADTTPVPHPPGARPKPAPRDPCVVSRPHG